MPRPVTAINLQGLAGIRHGFFTREGGVSGGLYAGLNCGLGSNDVRANVLENRGLVAGHLSATATEVVTPYQVHGAVAVIVDRPFTNTEPVKADAIVTRIPGLAIGVLTADCTPVLFADPGAGVVAAAHAGWKGAMGGVVESAIKAMETLGASRSRIRAAVGPSISQQAYEVGPEFEAQFLAADRVTKVYFQKFDPAGKPHFDLPGFVQSRLAAAGIGQIEMVTPCTYGDESKFYSFRRSQHRKEPDYGRQISAIVVT